jgi:Mg-chelatase subunit ChlD
LGHAAAEVRRAADHRHPEHVVTALARLTQAGKPLPGAIQQLRRIRARAQPGTKKKDIVWFALSDDRPLTAFAGIWTEFRGDRGTKSKPVPGPTWSMGF